MRRLIAFVLCAAALVLGPLWIHEPVAGQTRRPTLPAIGSEAARVLSAGNVSEALAPSARDKWQGKANGERPRGGVETYASVAPAVVVVRTDDGHGSGFFVSADGLLVTNHHVINSGLRHSPDASYAMIHLGQMSPAGTMSVGAEPVRAALFKVDPVRDLALLKVVPTAGRASYPFIKLSATAPKPGQDCSIIGHPSSGMLWTFRPCQVSSVGSWPRDLVNLVMPRLAAAGATRQSADEFVAAQSGHKILLTSAQANPGDSGGPVVDGAGALIGVTFAGPGNQAEDKFTYHVHLDEVRTFTASAPQSGMLLVPDVWDLPSSVDLQDIDGDRVPDVLVAGSGKQPEVLLFDLDGNSPRVSSPRELGGMVREKRWDFEAAIDLRGSGYIAYYDTDNSGGHDVVMVTNEDSPAAQGQFSLRGGRWTYEAVKNRRIMDPALIANPQLAQRLAALLKRIGM